MYRINSIKSNDPIINEILKYPDGTFVIFYIPTCPYSIDAVNLLENSGYPYYGYDINMIDGQMNQVLRSLNDNKDIVDFNPEHHTKPIIFYNGKFVGGFTELKQMLSN